MAKKVHPYTITNTLDKYIRLRQAQLIKESRENILLKDIYSEIAEFCGVTPHTIAMIKSGNHHPSLTVALKLSAYFDVDVRDLFTLEEVEDRI